MKTGFVHLGSTDFTHFSTFFLQPTSSYLKYLCYRKIEVLLSSHATGIIQVEYKIF
jgi:hypothetical protein